MNQMDLILLFHLSVALRLCVDARTRKIPIFGQTVMQRLKVTIHPIVLLKGCTFFSDVRPCNVGQHSFWACRRPQDALPYYTEGNERAVIRDCVWSQSQRLADEDGDLWAEYSAIVLSRCARFPTIFMRKNLILDPRADALSMCIALSEGAEEDRS